MIFVSNLLQRVLSPVYYNVFVVDLLWQIVALSMINFFVVFILVI